MMKTNKKTQILKELLTGNIDQKKIQEVSELDSVHKELMNQWNQCGKQIVAPGTKEKIWENINKKRKGNYKNQVHVVLWRTIAACAAIVLIIGSLWYPTTTSRNPVDEFIEIAATKNQTYILPDSSIVWMEQGSKLKYHRVFNEDRSVWLSGNSLFEVRKRQGSKFKVYIENAFIEVKGTIFRIEQNAPNANYITLFEGKIDFNVESTGQRTEMKPMERVIYNPNNAHVEVDEVTNLNWENGKYLFTDMPLQQLIKVINLMYNSNIILEKNINYESAFTGSIRFDEPLDDVLNKICFTLNLTNERQKGTIILKSEN